MSDVVQKLWGFCHTLRHDGIDYGDYIEQITFLLFLKMAEEKGLDLPRGCDWDTLRTASGSQLLDDYSDALRMLGKTPGILGDIYAEAQSRFSNAVNLKRLINLIDEVEWTGLGVDVKAAAYEGLLEKAASEGKKGAGQYFTPRVLIETIVRCMKPDPRAHPDFTICDPACGSGGFLVSAWEWFLEQTKGGAIERSLARRLRTKTFFGQDLVARPRRLALMNLYLHSIEPRIALGDTIYEPPGSDRFDVILTNPPFGTKGANQAPERDDFTIATSNKQLNFLQHVMTILKPGGRAAVVLPDNCLFDDKAAEVIELLMHDCNLHTVLRLPRGTFTPYSQGVNANVIFFTKGILTENVWIYDARTNIQAITKKDRPLTADHFLDFERCYGDDPSGQSRRKDMGPSSRFRRFSAKEISEGGFALDINWLNRLADDGKPPHSDLNQLVTTVISRLRNAADMLGPVIDLLKQGQTMITHSGNVPPGWAKRTVADAFVSYSGGTPDRSKPDLWGGAIPWISSGDVRAARISHASESISREGLLASSAQLCRPGSVVVVVRSGILKHTLPVAIVDIEAAINQDIKCFDSGDDDLNAWLALVFNASASAILGQRRDGTTVQSVKYDTLKNFTLYIPPKVELLRAMALVADIYEHIKRCEGILIDLPWGTQVSRSDMQANGLMSAILSKAIRGELAANEAMSAAKDCRSYEGAEEWLDRIPRPRKYVNRGDRT